MTDAIRIQRIFTADEASSEERNQVGVATRWLERVSGAVRWGVRLVVSDFEAVHGLQQAETGSAAYQLYAATVASRQHEWV